MIEQYLMKLEIHYFHHFERIKKTSSENKFTFIKTAIIF